MRPVATGKAASGLTRNPTTTPRMANGRAVTKSRPVSSNQVPRPSWTPPKEEPTISTRASTGSSTTMLAATLTPMYDHAGMGVTRSCRAHPEARSMESRDPPALRAAIRAPNEHIETMR